MKRSFMFSVEIRRERFNANGVVNLSIVYALLDLFPIGYRESAS